MAFFQTPHPSTKPQRTCRHPWPHPYTPRAQVQATSALFLQDATSFAPGPLPGQAPAPQSSSPSRSHTSAWPLLLPRPRLATTGVCPLKSSLLGQTHLCDQQAPREHERNMPGSAEQALGDRRETVLAGKVKRGNWQVERVRPSPGAETEGAELPSPPSWCPSWCPQRGPAQAQEGVAAGVRGSPPRGSRGTPAPRRSEGAVRDFPRGSAC